jgi:Na+/H+ antiporter NhaD/arsenite permease-like protein
VKAGNYQVTLGRMLSGTVTPIGNPQTVVVIGLNDQK